MTLDVIIGKRVLSEDEDKDINKYTVIECPNMEDGCSVEFTIYKNTSYRSGSSAFWSFWGKTEQIRNIYLSMRKHPNTNDKDVTLLKNHIDDINNINDNDFTVPCDQDRLKWFKFWSNKAIELYGNKAAIGFR
jgi:hypothetical protein